MEKQVRKYNLAAAIILFVVCPILLWVFETTTFRGVLKETISIITILSFSMMLLQFYLARSNKKVLKPHKMSRVVHWHKIIAYVSVPILIIHPFLLVLPRYFEAGVDPMDAFLKLITAFESWGVVLGIVAWCLILIIGITSFFRDKLPMTYKTWRIFHGILSILFIIIAAWHVIDLGRHAGLWMSVFIISLALGGIIMLAKVYFLKPNKGGTK